MIKKDKPPPDWRIDDPRQLGNYPFIVDPTDSAAIHQVEINGAPVEDASYQFVIKERRADA